MGRGVNMPWVGGRYTIGRGGQNTMGREGVQYILVIMGRGIIKFPNFQKKINISKNSKNFIKFQNKFHKIKKNQRNNSKQIS